MTEIPKSARLTDEQWDALDLSNPRAIADAAAELAYRDALTLLEERSLEAFGSGHDCAKQEAIEAAAHMVTALQGLCSTYHHGFSEQPIALPKGHDCYIVNAIAEFDEWVNDG